MVAMFDYVTILTFQYRSIQNKACMCYLNSIEYLVANNDSRIARY